MISFPQMGRWQPLRYRGYIYDQGIGLYYLQSRYYNPKIGRFINADALVSTGQGLLGNNMFAYCGNNPVCSKDPTGEAPWDIIGGAFVGAIAGLVFSIIDGDPWEEVLLDTLWGAVQGGVVTKYPKAAVIFSSVEVLSEFIDCMSKGLSMEKTLTIIAIKTANRDFKDTDDRVCDFVIALTFGMGKDLTIEGFAILIEGSGNKNVSAGTVGRTMTAFIGAGSGGGCFDGARIRFDLVGGE